MVVVNNVFIGGVLNDDTVDAKKTYEIMHYTFFKL